ncbi:MAG: hypothetical protein QOK47_836 [Actinomycetota bacterium]|nr:hypothetical protein [Actinomycetota bacterium]
MKRRTSRSILLAVVSMWIVGLWAMNVGATTAPHISTQPSCVPGGPPPVGCPPASASPTGSKSPTASGSPSGSPSPSESPEPETAKSTISIKYSKKAFSGTVDSSAKECEPGRSVTLKKKKGAKAKTVGKTETAAKGKWKIAYPDPGGKKYYAKVKASSKGSTSCGGAKSKTIKA